MIEEGQHRSQQATASTLKHYRLHMNIALSTTQIPPATSGPQEIITIIDLSQERALELLAFMSDITLRANTSSTIFRISSFEPDALIVPAHALKQLPAANDFLILPEDYKVTAITPIKGIHANVMPLYANWSATDEHDRFIITTVDINAQLLKLVSRGKSLPPGSTNTTLNTLSPDTLIITEQQWLH
jgi:hypothetical protein